VRCYAKRYVKFVKQKAAVFTTALQGRRTPQIDFLTVLGGVTPTTQKAVFKPFFGGFSCLWRGKISACLLLDTLTNNSTSFFLTTGKISGFNLR
jgi:hypothetical protein